MNRFLVLLGVAALLQLAQVWTPAAWGWALDKAALLVLACGVLAASRGRQQTAPIVIDPATVPTRTK